MWALVVQAVAGRDVRWAWIEPGTHGCRGSGAGRPESGMWSLRCLATMRGSRSRSGHGDGDVARTAQVYALLDRPKKFALSFARSLSVASRSGSLALLHVLRRHRPLRMRPTPSSARRAQPGRPPIGSFVISRDTEPYLVVGPVADLRRSRFIGLLPRSGGRMTASADCPAASASPPKRSLSRLEAAHVAAERGLGRREIGL